MEGKRCFWKEQVCEKGRIVVQKGHLCVKKTSGPPNLTTLNNTYENSFAIIA